MLKYTSRIILTLFIFAQTAVCCPAAMALEESKDTTLSYGDRRVAGLDVSQAVEADAEKMQVIDGEVAALYGREAVAVLRDPGGCVEIPLVIEREGDYALLLGYAGLTDSDKAIDLMLEIDGEAPLADTEYVSLTRMYQNEQDTFALDSRGNQLRPRMLQTEQWQESALYDKQNGTTDLYWFPLSEGEHIIRITAVDGGVGIASLRAMPSTVLPTYEEYARAAADAPVATTERIIQGEEAKTRSSLTLYPTTDRTSPATQPFEEGRTMLNTIGGSNWSSPGDWLEWSFTVEEAGLYEIALRVRQNELSGMKSYRTIRINGEILFQELASYGFAYQRSWYIETLSDPETGEAFQFYFQPGQYTLRMEVTTGEMKEVLAETEDILAQVNELYRSIVMITGTSPDLYRDYNLVSTIPELIPTMTGLADRLNAQMEAIRALTGGSASQAQSISALADQLEDMAEKPETIAKRVNNLYSNISALSSWSLSASQQPLELDYFRLGNRNSPPLQANAGFFQTIGSAIRSFVYSFLLDYDSVGDVTGDGPHLVVWTGMGREQAEALSQIVSRTFDSAYGTRVDLRLVQGNLVEAVAAGTGPDIALNLGMNTPVDYASRGILAPLDDFAGFEEKIQDEFYPGVLTPYQYGGRTWAVPETQDFDMLYYRVDILEQLGLQPPETWEDIRSMISVLARSNMSVGITSIVETAAGQVNMTLPKTLLTMLMQNGVSFYEEDLSGSKLDTPEAIDAFRQLTDLYTEYGLPVYFDGVNRFRTGEMPVIVASLSTYNYLKMTAPEIAGRWEMTVIPGVEREDGTIDHTGEFTSSASVMFNTCENPEAGWEFLQWWISEETQYQYGMELEAILGVSGRYLTANRKAFERLPWSAEATETIRQQWTCVRTIPTVPGYYFVGRYLTNAISDVVVNGSNARVTMEQYAAVINDELARKNKQLQKYT